MIRGLRILSIAVLLFAAAMFWMTAHPVASGVCLAVAVVLIALALLKRRRERAFASVLPSDLERLAWRSDETAVAFVWRFRRGREARVRILRSEKDFADRGTARHEQLVVYDGQGDQAVDDTVHCRRTYYYTLLVEHGLRRPDVLHLEIPTVPSDERLKIEATWAPPQSTSDGGRDALTTAVRHLPGSDQASAAVLGEIVGGVISDAVFAAAEVLAGERLPDEWVEVE